MQQPTLEQSAVAAFTIAFVCKLILLCMGICLLLPYPTFASAPSGYRWFIASGVPEPLWGLYFTAVGVAGLLTLRRAHARVRIGLGILGGSTYVGLAVMFLVANPAGLIAWVFIPLALLDFFALPYLQWRS